MAPVEFVELVVMVAISSGPCAATKTVRKKSVKRMLKFLPSIRSCLLFTKVMDSYVLGWDLVSDGCERLEMCFRNRLSVEEDLEWMGKEI